MNADPVRDENGPAPESHLATIAALEPVRGVRRRWPALLNITVTIAMLVGLVNELLDHGLLGFERAVPDSPLFYVCFLAAYFTLPLSDLAIFRRLWNLPLSAFGALNRKRIANDVLIGYTGDAYFYAWARQKLKMVAAPFGAVKDVSIVSGMAGNTAALLLAAASLPLGYRLIDPGLLRTMLWSLATTALVMITVLALRRIVFSLSRRDLLFIFRLDVARILIGALLTATAWHFAMPEVSLFMWLFLMAGRQLVSRLPFLPNKDLLFANFAILIIGRDKALSNLMAFTATTTLLLHVALLTLFGLIWVWERTAQWRTHG